MTVTSENRVSGPFVGPGPVFTYTFDVFDDGDLEVTHTDEDGLNSVKVLTTDYTVNRTLKQVTLVTPFVDNLTSSDKITLRGKLPNTQLVDLANQGAWDPSVIEEMFDRHTMVALAQQEEIDRCLKVQVGETFDQSALTADYFTKRPRLLAEHVAAGGLDEVIYLEAYSGNANAYDVLEMEILNVFVQGASAAVDINMQMRSDGVWTGGSGRQWAARAVDSSGNASVNNPSGPGNDQRLTLSTDWDRGVSWGGGRIMFSRGPLNSQAGDSHFAYTLARSGASLVACTGGVNHNSTGNGIDGFRIYTDGITAEVTGTVRLWGHPNV